MTSLVPWPTPPRSARRGSTTTWSGSTPTTPRRRRSPRTWTACSARVPTFTIEGYLDGVRTFADSANRAEGGRRWAAVVLVGLLLAVAAYVVYDALLFVVGTWL